MRRAGVNVRPVEEVLMRWARRKALKVDVIHSLPKPVQREFIDALLDAYAKGYEAAVAEMAQPVSLSTEGV